MGRSKINALQKLVNRMTGSEIDKNNNDSEVVPSMPDQRNTLVRAASTGRCQSRREYEKPATFGQRIGNLDHRNFNVQD